MKSGKIVTTHKFQGIVLNPNNLSDVRSLEKNILNFLKLYYKELNIKTHFIVTDTNVINHNFAEQSFLEKNSDSVFSEPLFAVGDNFMLTVHIENPSEKLVFQLAVNGVRFFLSLTEFE